MFQVKRETPYAALAAEWARAATVPDELVERTRDALAGARPDELPQVEPLVRALLAALEQPGRR
ncbi:MAG TPA: hypothetical protein VD838_16570, partial [Anaeromyxobacteraceae bacterium]|nr:hypothetical protein [Anaeromyxobacteraceae bacterium]